MRFEGRTRHAAASKFQREHRRQPGLTVNVGLTGAALRLRRCVLLTTQCRSCEMYQQPFVTDDRNYD